MKTTGMFAACAIFWLGGLASAVAEPFAPDGLWNSREGKGYGKAYVEVRPCEPNLCAKIVKLDYPRDAGGRLYTDDLNKTPALRDRTILGIPVFFDMRRVGANDWAGKVYDPERGGTYRGYVRMLGPDRMRVKGCLFTSWTCRTYIWKRVE